ncbi:hypothetical protein HLV39_03895 [Marinobacter adhaerens]|uniref:NADH-quinone oxidoreductase subunit D domain-containing protein n=1 Tax=Marinobacter adhaerens TaxID=1033846 RepID=A0A851HTN1_9GAMM|nr:MULTISPECIES: hypothetical protein [Marinobacter]NWN90642.1 hypothetical protein [Marinobacter adhaerens]
MAVTWFRKLGNQAPVPVFPLVGKNGEAALEALHLSPAVTIVQSPKQARALAVLGCIDHQDQPAFRRVHDQVPAPRVTGWCSTMALPKELSDTAVVVASADQLGTQVQQAVHALDAGQRRSDPNLCPDEPPAPWKGVGDGHGGEGMMGGKPYGRPMAMPEDDLRDGLQLDPLAFSFGPFSSLLPPGMVAKVRLHGDVIAGWEIASQPYELTLPSVFFQALEQPVAIEELELARAAFHLRRLAGALQVNGLGAHARRLRHKVAGLTCGQTLTEVANAHILESLRWVAGADKGVVHHESQVRLRGPAARATGDPRDARLNDPAYAALGFEPVVQQQGNCAARWKQWRDEAGQALALAAAAAETQAMSSPYGAVESPVGELTTSTPPADISDLLPSMLIGLEWSEAMSVLASLDVPAVRYADVMQVQGGGAL